MLNNKKPKAAPSMPSSLPVGTRDTKQWPDSGTMGLPFCNTLRINLITVAFQTWETEEFCCKGEYLRSTRLKTEIISLLDEIWFQVAES